MILKNGKLTASPTEEMNGTALMWEATPASLRSIAGRGLSAATSLIMRMFVWLRRVGIASALAISFLLPTPGLSATLLGQPIQPGKTMEIRFPVAKYFQDYAAQGGNPRVSVGRAVLAFPKDFNPARPWPILVVTSTTDDNRTSPMDVPFYERPATEEGWIVFAADATVHARLDSTVWRLGLLSAALETLRQEWPQSAKWPVAFGGWSGGAKRSGFLGAMLAKTGSVNICGFFLCGINDDRLSAAYKEYHAPASLLSVPIWLSSGMRDRIAPPRAHEHVKLSLEQTGFRQVRVELFDGGHQVKPGELKRALQWFREVGKF